VTAQKMTHREMIWLAIAVAVSLAVHGFFAIRGFGEPDAARLAVQASVWARTGELLNIGYTVRTSPLYIQWLRCAIDAGLPLEKLPGFMCGMNVLLGSLSLIPMYMLWRRLVSARAAALALVLCSFMPAFWLANVYGMPHLPAMFFFLCGLLCFCHGAERAGWRAVAWLAASVLLASIGIGLKADIVLCYGAFLWFAVQARPVSLRNVAVACLTPAIGVLASMLHTRLVSPQYISASQWSENFPFTLRAITSIENDAAVVMASGIVLFAVMMMCLLYCVIRRRHMSLLVLAMIWVMPVALFWCLKPGNIARHMMAGYVPLALVTAAVVAHVIADRRWLLAVVACILAANYFASPWFSLPRTGRPSSRLFEARQCIQARVESWHAAGKNFADAPDKRKFLFGSDYVFYAMWETFASARSLTHTRNGWSVVGTNGEQEVRFAYVPANKPLPEVELGWTVYQWLDNGQRSSIARVSTPDQP
jgi:hypothetical protein